MFEIDALEECDSAALAPPSAVRSVNGEGVAAHPSRNGDWREAR
jgi:hypothetical protein